MKLIPLLLVLMSLVSLQAAPLLSIYDFENRFRYCFSDRGRTHCAHDREWEKLPPLKNPSHLVYHFGLGCAVEGGKLECWGSNSTSLMAIKAASIKGVKELDGENFWVKTDTHVYRLHYGKEVLSIALPPGNWQYSVGYHNPYFHDGKNIYKVDHPGPYTKLYIKKLKTEDFKNCWGDFSLEAQIHEDHPWSIIWSDKEKIVFCHADLGSVFTFRYPIKRVSAYYLRHYLIENRDGKSAIEIKADENYRPEIIATYDISEARAVQPCAEGICVVRKGEEVFYVERGKEPTLVRNPGLYSRIQTIADGVDLLRSLAISPPIAEADFLEKWEATLSALDPKDKKLQLGYLALAEYLPKLEESNEFCHRATERLLQVMGGQTISSLPSDLQMKNWALERLGDHLTGLSSALPAPTLARWNALNSKLQQIKNSAADLKTFDTQIKQLEKEIETVLTELGSLPFSKNRDSVARNLVKYVITRSEATK